jgi:hypothetical protein
MNLRRRSVASSIESELSITNDFKQQSKTKPKISNANIALHSPEIRPLHPIQILSTLDEQSVVSTIPQISLTFGIRIYYINKINTSDKNFEIDFRLFVTWPLSCNHIDSITGLTREPEYGHYFVLSNAVSDVDIVDVSPYRVIEDQGYIRKSWRLRSSLSSEFNLEDFPKVCHYLTR